MKVQYKKSTVKSVAGDVVVLGVTTEGQLSQALSTLDKQTDGFFSQLLKKDFLPSKDGEIRTFYHVEGVKASSVAVVAYQPTQAGLVKAAKSVAAYLRKHDFKKAALQLLDESFDALDNVVKARLLVQNLLSADYLCDTYKSEKTDRSNLDIAILSNEASEKAVETGIEQGVAIAAGMNTLKDLGNAPGNVCTPKYLADYAEKMAKSLGSLAVEVLKEKDIKAHKMGALLSVSKGSDEKPRLIKIEHQGGKGAPIVLVGKGVTFDTGGISLKPGAGMDEMKYDMCGAGSVIGAMKTIAMLNLPINVIGIVPTVENMPSGRATKPGDIVTSMSGKTIEVLNTDAEGRMILCDALTYAQQFKPKAVIDIATLTGAVIVALGREASGLMSNDDDLAATLSDAGTRTGDRVWRLPLWDEYTKLLKSPFADLQNIGGRDAGTITAGCFLGEFTKDVAWAHIDIAGTAWSGGKNKGATGRPVPLLVEYVMSQLTD